MKAAPPPDRLRGQGERHLSLRGESGVRPVGGAGESGRPSGGHPLTLQHDPDWRERLGRNGRAYVEARYTPQVVARQYATRLERTVG
jgi:hypothetical protein